MYRYNINHLLNISISKDFSSVIIRGIENEVGYFRSNVENEERDNIDLEIQPYENFKEDGLNYVYHYHLCGQHGVMYHDIKNRLCVKKENNCFRLYADNPVFLVNIFVQIILVSKGYSFIHAAAFNANNKATIITGAGGIGKSPIHSHAVKNMGYLHFGDDLIILGRDKKCYPYPRSMAFKPHHKHIFANEYKKLKLPRFNQYNYKKFIIENAPFVALTKNILKKTNIYYEVVDKIVPKPYLGIVDSQSFYGKNKISHPSEIRRIIHLERIKGEKEKIISISAKKLINNMFSNIHYAWKDVFHIFVSLGALDVIFFDEYIKNISSVLEGSISNSEKLCVQVPECLTAEDLIIFFEKQKLFD